MNVMVIVVSGNLTNVFTRLMTWTIACRVHNRVVLT
jgi:hypothetical protein